MAPQDPESSTNTHIRMQYNMLLEIQSYLSKFLKKEIEIAAFDPLYTPLDEEILANVGIRTSTHPVKGFLEVDDSTAFISLAPSVAMKQVVTDVAKPAMIIWGEHPVPEMSKRYDTEPENLEYDRMMNRPLLDRKIEIEDVGNVTILDSWW